MDEKPEALRLADVLWPWHEGVTNNLSMAAAELRRLHEVNQELLKTLKWLDRWLGGKPMTECSSRILEAEEK
jgi:hypothetical protein